jgi:GGDEF domain-containing protein
MNATPSGFSSLQTHFILESTPPFRLISYWTRLGLGTLINWIMPGGEERWLVVETAVLHGMTARYYRDVTEMLRLKKERDMELREQSLRDADLSCLLSRHGILVALEPLVARSRRHNTPLSVVVMGPHTEPLHDELHLKLSYLLKGQTRWTDLVGANEQRDFIIILRETTQDNAMQLVEKLSGYLDRLGNGQGTAPTACFGVTSCQKNV